MLVLSHRGYHVRVPENTLEAFEQAVALGVDGIETDVRLTADGQAVLLHDRLAPTGEAVSSLTRAELEHRTGHPVPTVEEAVGQWADILWNLEIKTPAAVAATAATIRRFGAARRFLVSSFWHTSIEQIGHLVEVDAALLFSHRPLSGSLAGAIAHFPKVRTLVWNFEFLEVDLLEEARSNGLRNFVYGALSPAEHECLATWPVDGVITDRPELLKFAQTPASASP